MADYIILTFATIVFIFLMSVTVITLSYVLEWLFKEMGALR